MIALTHTVVGAAIGLLSPNIFMAFIFGLFSHYLLDFIPHSDYILSDFQKNNFTPLKMQRKQKKQLSKGDLSPTEFRKTGLIKKIFNHRNILFIVDISISFIILFLILLIYKDRAALIFFGFVGAVLPDVLAFSRKVPSLMLERVIFLRTCNKFHDIFHRSLSLKYKKIGFVIQLFLISAILWIILTFFPK